jgi:phosphoesterase RecJ-like protein
MKNNIDKHSSEILKEIKKSKNILLHLHVNPDPDSIGSALAMYWALKKLNKKVTIIRGQSKFPENLSFIPGTNKITLKNYHEIAIEKYDLFIILDSASKEMISNLQEVVFPKTLKTIIIDHHKTNKKYADINLVEEKSSSASEIVFDLLKKWKIKIDKNIAACVFMGIYGDTGGFSYSNTSPETFRKISEITKILPSFHNLISNLRLNHPKEKFLFDILALNKVETFFNDTVAISTVSFNELKSKNIKKEDLSASTIPSFLISVKNWQIGVTVIEKEPGHVSISFRSKNDIDVSKIASALGGGGHKMAAGAFLKNCKIGEAKQKVIEAISGVI